MQTSLKRIMGSPYITLYYWIMDSQNSNKLKLEEHSHQQSYI